MNQKLWGVRIDGSLVESTPKEYFKEGPIDVEEWWDAANSNYIRGEGFSELIGRSYVGYGSKSKRQVTEVAAYWKGLRKQMRDAVIVAPAETTNEIQAKEAFLKAMEKLYA